MGEKIGDGMDQLKDMNLSDKINIKSIEEVMENAKDVIGDQIDNLGDIIPDTPSVDALKDIDFENAVSNINFDTSNKSFFSCLGKNLPRN